MAAHKRHLVADFGEFSICLIILTTEINFLSEFGYFRGITHEFSPNFNALMKITVFQNGHRRHLEYLIILDDNLRPTSWIEFYWASVTIITQKLNKKYHPGWDGVHNIDLCYYERKWLSRGGHLGFLVTCWFYDNFDLRNEFLDLTLAILEVLHMNLVQIFMILWKSSFSKWPPTPSWISQIPRR